ncbi:poly-beta-1,6-N-acetyl-D-glucosamine biosynthesis protein PgaD [Deltaproteobacteria bacterium]|nr:poly-beta-1,6-N-acetyl-D-glucosamine biosynthesis protein PgaD [Deltaproteobacteria bacterium]
MRLGSRQSGQIPQPPLIIRNDAQSHFQRHGYRALTVLFWLLFLALFRVAITPLAWFAGLQNIYELLSYKVDGSDFAQQLSIYGLVVLLIGLILLGWARYNQFRFSSRERRTVFLAPVEQTEIAAFFQQTAQQSDVGAGARRMVIHHDESGRVVDIAADCSELLFVPHEPVPLQRNSYQYGGYQLNRGADLCWIVTQQGCEVFRGGSFENCRNYVDSLTC